MSLPRNFVAKVMGGAMAAFTTKLFVGVFVENQEIKDKHELLHELEEAGAFFVVPPTFFAKPRPPVNLFLRFSFFFLLIDDELMIMLGLSFLLVQPSIA
ncbi:unnamed protein product [Arabidopsis lyrata]|nr:unnamed protein product [Arabidopsis lyrata]